MAGVIETYGLAKRYGGVTAVSDLNLRGEAGQVFGFLGPNGAGKSATIRMLMACSGRRRAGRPSWVSMPPPAASRSIAGSATWPAISNCIRG
jgi:ABC-type uncharacterized transport system ATPase subunit